MNLFPARSPARPDGLPLLLVAVNLLLLSFFVLLNALSSQPTSKQERHADEVLARVREGYDSKAPRPQQGGALPELPRTAWAEALTRNVQGVMTNRLQFEAEVLSADADRVVLRLPIQTVFAEGQLRDPDLIKALQMAAQGAHLQWQVAGRAPVVVSQGAQLAALTTAVAMIPAARPELRVIITPAPQTAPAAAGGLQGMATQHGGTVEGQAAP